MSLYFQCANPRQLLADFKKAIDEKTIATWGYDSDGDFTHTPSQWAKLAWMRPSIGTDRLTFNIIPPNGKVLSKEIYGVYHGRLAESLTVHFDEKFSTATATAKATSGDVVGG